MSTAPSGALTPDRQPQPVHPPASTGPITRLSPAQARLADYLVRGLTIEQVATETRLSPRTVTKHAAALRIKFRCPARCSMAVLKHALIATGQSTPPPPSRPAPHLSTQQLHLLRALTKHTATRDIAQAAGIEPADVRTHIDALIVDAGADDTADLVVLAHGWGLLGHDQAAATCRHVSTPRLTHASTATMASAKEDLVDLLLPSFVDRLLSQGRDPGDVPRVSVTEATGWLAPLAARILDALNAAGPQTENTAFMAHGHIHLPLTGDAGRATYLRVAAQSTMVPWAVPAVSLILTITGTVALEMYEDATGLASGHPQYARTFGPEQVFTVHPGTLCATESSLDAVQVLVSVPPQFEAADKVVGEEHAATVEKARRALGQVAAGMAGDGRR